MKSIKSSYIFLLIIGACLFHSCSDEVELTDVDLRFTLTYEDAPLVGFNQFTYPLDFEVFFTKYSMYISDLKLLSDEGDYVLSEVEFIDLLTGVDTEERAQAGQIRSFSNVPTRTYSGLSFNIGVPEELNSTAPADYPIDSPLSNNGEYWVGWTSYIFHKIEGKMDSDMDGNPEAGIALHLGSDDAFRTININQILELSDASESININFDLKDILEIDGAFFDFNETPQIHHLGVLPRALPILDNTKPVIRLD